MGDGGVLLLVHYSQVRSCPPGHLFFYLAMNLGLFFKAPKYHQGQRQFEALRRRI